MPFSLEAQAKVTNTQPRRSPADLRPSPGSSSGSRSWAPPPAAPCSLVQHLRARSAWLAQHILPHEPDLRAWLRRRKVDGLEIDDVIQDIYAILAGLESVAHIATPRAYAFQTAKSLIVRHLQRGQILQIAEIELAAVMMDEPSPERRVSSREQLLRVSELIASLPPKCREAFCLRKIDGLSQREIAVRMALSESTVEKHIGRGLRLLRSALTTSGQDTLGAAAVSG